MSWVTSSMFIVRCVANRVTVSRQLQPAGEGPVAARLKEKRLLAGSRWLEDLVPRPVDPGQSAGAAPAARSRR